jgi:hypothetical protein
VIRTFIIKSNVDNILEAVNVEINSKLRVLLTSGREESSKMDDEIWAELFDSLTEFLWLIKHIQLLVL